MKEKKGNCKVESGNGRKSFRCITSMMALVLLLICCVFSLPLHAAVPTQAALASDLNSGMDIPTIIKNAVDAGMTTQQAVAAVIKAGADPKRTVYSAITAGYSAQDVIKGAAAGVDSSSPGQVAKIISAAREAGVSESDINGWLASAGVSSSVIASAGTLASEDTSPVLGGTVPSSDIPLTAIIGQSGIGGGGGGTSPASKSK